MAMEVRPWPSASNKPPSLMAMAPDQEVAAMAPDQELGVMSSRLGAMAVSTMAPDLKVWPSKKQRNGKGSSMTAMGTGKVRPRVPIVDVFFSIFVFSEHEKGNFPSNLAIPAHPWPQRDF